MNANDPAPANEPLAAEAPKFLERDFNQCFQQMRHYDAQSLEICKFAATVYSAVVGLSFALYKYGVAQNIDYSIPSGAALAVAFLFGIGLLAMMVRNRVYFVIVTRYINEHRGHFLKAHPLGFENLTEMYTNPKLPPFLHWRSSETMLMAVVSAMNGFLAAAAVHFLCWVTAPRWKLTILLAAAAFIAQAGWFALYLSSREKKGASKAVFNQK